MDKFNFLTDTVRLAGFNKHFATPDEGILRFFRKYNTHGFNDRKIIFTFRKRLYVRLSLLEKWCEEINTKYGGSIKIEGKKK